MFLVLDSIKMDYWIFSSSPLSPRLWQNTRPNKSKRRPLSPFVFGLWQVFCFPCFHLLHEICPLAHQDLPFDDYAREFCKLAAAMAWGDATLNRLLVAYKGYEVEPSASPSKALCRACAPRAPSSASPLKALCYACAPRAPSSASLSKALCRACAPRVPSSAGPLKALCSVCASRVPPSVFASRALPSVFASRAPPSVFASRAPPSVRASRAHPIARSSRAPTRVHSFPLENFMRGHMPWLLESPDPLWPPELPEPSWSPELPAPGWVPERASSWRPSVRFPCPWKPPERPLSLNFKIVLADDSVTNARKQIRCGIFQQKGSTICSAGLWLFYIGYSSSSSTKLIIGNLWTLHKFKWYLNNQYIFFSHNKKFV